MGKELLIAKDLKQYFPIGKDRFVRAVDGVNFSINEGEVMGLVGESGSGKSTIAYTVMGMYVRRMERLFLTGRPLRIRQKDEAKIFAGMHRLYFRIRLIPESVSRCSSDFKSSSSCTQCSFKRRDR